MRIVHLSLLALIATALVGCGSKSGTIEDPPETQPTTGTVEIELQPAGLAASWTLTGPESLSVSGTRDTVMTDMPVGGYWIDWGPVTWYFQPVDDAATLVDEGTIRFIGYYTQDPYAPASVIIDVSPDEYPPRWVLKSVIGGGDHDVIGQGDATITGLPAGPVTIDWQPYPDHVEPDGGQLDVVLDNGQTYTAIGAYVPRDAMAMEMVRIEGGAFTMGSPEWEMGYDGGLPRRPDDETPPHEVTLTRSLLVGVTEVTQGQYAKITGHEPSHFGPGDNLPVEGVSWYEAVEFCNALSANKGLTPAYEVMGTVVSWDRNADGYRLPTEAEWEFLCRGGRDEAFAHGPFSGLGDDPDPVLERLGWYAHNTGGVGGTGTRPVAAKHPNAFGLYDMHGNVEEWCWDRYASDWYGQSPTVNPEGPLTGATRVIRGGSYASVAAGCRSAARLQLDPQTGVRSVGLRVVRRADQPLPAPKNTERD